MAHAPKKPCAWVLSRVGSQQLPTSSALPSQASPACSESTSSAPVVASAFHPALAPVGVLLAVLGYALGTYAGWLSGHLMRVVAP